MIAIFLLFSIFFIFSYVLYYRKRYKDCYDKKLFLQEKLYGSTLWVSLLVIIPFILVNALLDTPEVIKKEVAFSQNSLGYLKEKRDDEQLNLDFHFIYINKYHNRTHSTASDVDLEDFYQRLAQEEPDIGNWSLAYHYLVSGKHEASLKYLQEVQNEKLKYLNLSYGKTYAALSKDSLALNHLIKSIEIHPELNPRSFTLYAVLVEQSNDINVVKSALALDGYEDYLDFDYIRKKLLEYWELKEYALAMMHWFSSGLDITGFIAAFLILLVWLVYLIKLSFFEKINWYLLTLVLLLEMIFCFFTFFIGDLLTLHFGLWEAVVSTWDLLLYSIFGVGLVEEFVKILPTLIVFIFFSKKLQPYEYLLIACFSALGFAFIENIIYFDRYSYTIIHGRALTAAVGHMIFSTIYAYGLVLSRFKYRKLKSWVAFFLFWFLASVAHGLYDFWIFSELYLFFYLFFIIIARAWITMLNNSLNNSKNFEYSGKYQGRYIKFYLAFSLTAILMFEYVIVGFTSGPTIANLNLLSAGFSGSLLIVFLGSKLSSINLIRKYWANINFSINPLTDDTVSQNFIGRRVHFNSYYADRGLIEYLNDGVQGTIISRQILLKRRSTKYFSYQDPEWFLVKLDEPVQSDYYKKRYALIKFKESHSSLNAKKHFLVNFHLIPNKVSKPRMLRSNYHSLGWSFLRTHPKLD